jgi:hypothetical protein
MFEFHFVSLQKICQQEIQAIQNTIETNHKLLQESQHNQQKYQKDTIAAQSKFNALLTDHATIQLTRKQMLLSAIANIDTTYEIAKKQQFLLEEKALISIQKPYEKVIQEVKEQQKNQVLEGYLIKQGNGSTTFNPLGRKNWKERYFILIGNTLFYAKTKDEYERGHIIKELCLKG